MENEKKIKIARILSLCVVVFMLVSGSLLLFVPSLSALVYDLSGEKNFTTPLARAMGIRQFTIGMMFLALTLANQLKALSYLMITCALIPIADFLIFAPTIGWISSLRHAASVPMVLTLGFYIRSIANRNH